jgi:GNAT superfamily N-acetyltransferase
MSTWPVRAELRAVQSDDPAALTLLTAARAEIDARQANEELSGVSTRRPVAEAMNDDREILVAYAGGLPVGLAALRTFGPGIGEIKRMYVDPAYRGAGVARRLLQSLEQRAREYGFELVRLDTHDRLTEANRLYRASGYREIDDYNGNPRANRWFEKSLA